MFDYKYQLMDRIDLIFWLMLIHACITASTVILLVIHTSDTISSIQTTGFLCQGVNIIDLDKLKPDGH